MPLSDLLARPWAESQLVLEAAGISYEIVQTRASRDFFGVDEQQLYVLRIRDLGACVQIALAPAPLRSDTVAAYEKTI